MESYPQGFLSEFTNICDAAARMSSSIRKYSQLTFSMFARTSSCIRKHLQCISKDLFVYLQIFATQVFNMRQVFITYSKHLRCNWLVFFHYSQIFTTQVFNIRKVFFHHSQMLAMQWQGFLVIFANIRNASFQCSQGFPCLFANL